MPIYFRRVNEDRPENKRVWKQEVIRDAGKGDKGSGLDISMLIKQEIFEKGAHLYYVEKGDDTYGVFSYAIAKLAVIDIGFGRGEFIIPPSSDVEWDDAARGEVYRLISKGSLDRLGFDELAIRIRKDDSAEKSFLEECGFSIVEQGNRQDGTLMMSVKRKMKVMVTGVNSELGFEVVQEIFRRGFEVLGCDIDIKMDSSLSKDEDIPYTQLDISDEKATKKVIHEFTPNAIINCYAWSAVDDAELPENQEAVYNANVKGTINLAKCCREINAKMMLLSSDYVFDGSGSEPWNAECRDYAPLNYYGSTKAEAEKAVSSLLSRFFVLRTEWTFGKKSRNFVDLLLELAKTRDEITIVEDQVGVPTYFHDLARLVVDMIQSEKYGFYNVTNSGSYVSRNEYAKEILRQASALGHSEYDEDRIKVESVSSEEYQLSKAIRPLNSRLDISKIKDAGFKALPDWKNAVHRYLEEKGF